MLDLYKRLLAVPCSQVVVIVLHQFSEKTRMNKINIILGTQSICLVLETIHLIPSNVFLQMST